MLVPTFPGGAGRGCGNAVVSGIEQCDGANLAGEDCISQGFVGGTLQCYPNCGFDTSACTAVAGCGDRFPDAGEECDPGIPSGTTCVSEGFSSNEPLTCDANCGINYSQCRGAIDLEGAFDGSTLERAIATSDTWTEVRLIDALGDVGDVSRPGPSVHKIYLFFHRTGTDTWGLYFAGPDEEYVDGTKGQLRPIGMLSVRMDGAGRVSHVDGVAGATGSIEVGAASTGAFANSSAAPVDVEVRLDAVEVRNWTWPNGGTAPSAFHWSTRFVAGEPGTAAELQLGKCADTQRCQASWNTSTGRYEATHQTYDVGVLSGATKFSDWERTAEALKSKGFDMVTLDALELPEQQPPSRASCERDISFDTSSITFPNQIMLVLDRSGSMSEPAETLGGNGRTRLEYVQSAAQTFAWLQSNATADVELGLISFNDEVDRELPLRVVNAFCAGTTPDFCETECVRFAEDPENCGGCGIACEAGDVCSAGTCAGTCAAGRTDCDASCVNLNFNVAHCGSCDNACAPGERCDVGSCTASPTPLANLPRVTPAQFTNVLNGLEATGATAAGDALREAETALQGKSGVRAVLLLTDGQSNTGEEPAPVIDDLIDQGIEFYLVPTGPDAPQDLGLSSLSSAPGSSMAALFDARAGHEAPAAFFEAFARSRSESLIRGRTLSAVSEGPPIVKQTLDIGEPSTPTPSGPAFPATEEFTLQVESLAERLNVVVSSNNAFEDPWLPGLSLIDPNGNERLNDQSAGVSISSLVRLLQVPNPREGEWKLRVSARGQVAQRSLLLAHVESPLPDCQVRVSPEYAAAGENVTVTAHAFWGKQWIARGVAYRGQVTSPDGSVTRFSLTASPDPLVGARGSFRANGSYGIHEVRVTCDVKEGAAFGAGEAIFDREEPYGPNPGTVKPFYREAIVNVPVRDPGICTVSPASVGCCTSPLACPGTKNIALFTGLGGSGNGGGGGSNAFSGFELADRAKVTGPSGLPTEIVSAGTQRAEFGADSTVVGAVFSVSDVFARERANILGRLTTEGSLTTQNNVVISGGVVENGNLTLPGALELPVFPSTDWGSRHLEPQTRLALRPGVYGSIVVKSRATLQLEAGTYWFRSLQIEPQAVVRTSGTTPTRIFVQGDVMLKESIRHTSGKHDRLLLLSLGTQEIFVEQPWSGTLVAPNASVTLSGQNTTTHRGAVFARGVRVRAGVTLEHHGFPWTWIPGGVPVVPASQRAASNQDPEDSGGSPIQGGCHYAGSHQGGAPAALSALVLLALVVSRRRSQDVRRAS